MALPMTELEGSVDVAQTGAGRLVITKIADRSGREFHKLISDPLDDEGANHAVGGQLGALERLGVPAGLTAAARELREWWDTDRFELLYFRHHAKEDEAFPTLERAFSFAESMSDYGEGAPDEIREVTTGRILYRHKIGGWERVAADAPAVEEFAVET